MVKRHLENEPAKEARITAFMAEWGTGLRSTANLASVPWRRLGLRGARAMARRVYGAEDWYVNWDGADIDALYNRRRATRFVVARRVAGAPTWHSHGGTDDGDDDEEEQGGDSDNGGDGGDDGDGGDGDGAPVDVQLMAR